MQLCNAFVELLSPLVEVVIHDIVKNEICYISGSLSGRNIGDPSLLEPELLTQSSWSAQRYSKRNFDGRLVKSISIPFEDNKLICLNCDVSVFQTMKKLSDNFLELGSAQSKPKALFKNDWQEKLHVAIYEYLTEYNWEYSRLNNKQKKQLLLHLYQLGIFEQKNAADYLAKHLSMGRATIFNYLRAWRQDENI